MSQKAKKSTENTMSEEEEQYLTYTINCEKFMIIIKDNAKVKNFRVMSGQPTNPPTNPPKGGQ